MRTKVTLVLVFLNVALFFFIFKFERSWRTEAASLEARHRVLGPETADIRSLDVTTNPPGGGFALVRNRETWMLTRPLDWPANPHAVDRILRELQLLENETSFSVKDLAKNGQALADYGLDQPKLTVMFASGEGAAAPADGRPTAQPTTLLRIGDATKVGNRLYVLSPDGQRIHVVNRSLVDALSLPLDQLRADSLLTIRPYEARALSVQTSGVRVRVRRDSTGWLFDTIINARASKTEMDLTIQELIKLRAKSFPATHPATLPSAAPSLRVTLDGNNRTETLFLGEPMPGATTKEETEFYAQLMNNNTVRTPVFTVAVSNDLLEKLRSGQETLREHRILDFDPAAVTAITLAAPGQPPITLQRLENAAARTDGGWQLVQTTAGPAGPQTQPADSAAVKRLLDRLTLLAAKKFESDAPSSAQLEAWGFNRPEREITLVRASAGNSAGAPLVLRLGTDVRGNVFARVAASNDAASSVYAVDVDLARDFPVDSKAWRDRTLRELPATARIAALKLTDLSTHAAVFETTFDPAGQPTPPPRDAAALQALIRSLRSLRAQRLVQDTFAEKFMLAGDERTWRYQLDATIALPGGAGGEQTSTMTLFFTDRVGGAEQLGGAKDLDVIFEVEQPLLDALWTLAYGPRDPGPAPGK